MKRVGLLVLELLGTVFLLLALAGGVVLGCGIVPRERLGSALQALRGQTQAVPKEAPVPSPPPESGILLEARERLDRDQAAFQQVRTQAGAQLQAERTEIERLKAEVERRLQEPASSKGAPAEASAEARIPLAASGKGAKAVAEISAKMQPRAVVQLLQQESEEGVVQVLKRMDPKQAGKVMAEMLSSDAARAQKIESMMRTGQNP